MPDAQRLIQELIGDQKITVVDVGARNDTLELPRLASRIQAFGFEPNPDEYQKLIANKTDRYVASGKPAPTYRSINYLDVALHDRLGMADLYITEGAGACGLLEPNERIVNQLYFFQHQGTNAPFGPQFQVKNISSVKVSTLDQIAVEFGLDSIDHLKLDTEGTEYQILGAGSSLLSSGKVSVIKCEVSFLEIRKNQNLFRDVDNLLQQYGFVLIDLTIATRVMLVPERTTFEKGQIAVADAIYALDMDRIPNGPDKRMRAIKAGIVLANLGYVSFGAALISRYSECKVEDLLNALGGPKANPSLARLKSVLGDIMPPVIYRWLLPVGSRVYQKLRSLVR